MATLSVVITAYNEEKNIKDCIESIKGIADEIIVVDNTSADKTAQIAKNFTKKIFKQKNDSQNIDIQKNLGFSKAKEDWVLSLDADERVTPELAKEIKGKIENENITGYWIPRKNIIFNQWIQHTGWYPDYQLRLFRKGKGKFVSKHVHEDIKVDGSTEKLLNPLVHYNYETISQFIYKHAIIYAPNEAEALIKKGYTFSYLDAIRFPVDEFLSRFFARKGYKDGLHGLVLSLLMAFYHLVVFVNIWEQKDYKEINPKDFFDDTHDELVSTYKKVAHWLVQTKTEESNPLKRYVLKVQHKILNG